MQVWNRRWEHHVATRIRRRQLLPGHREHEGTHRSLAEAATQPAVGRQRESRSPPTPPRVSGMTQAQALGLSGRSTPRLWVPTRLTARADRDRTCRTRLHFAAGPASARPPAPLRKHATLSVSIAAQSPKVARIPSELLRPFRFA